MLENRSPVETAEAEGLKNKKKKRLLTVIIVVSIITLISLLLHSLGIIDLNTTTVSKEVKVSYEVEPYRLSMPDWETDIFTLKSYLEKNRNISYTTMGAQTVGVSDGNYSRYGGDGLKFMGEYFDALMHGDHELVNSMHTERFIKEHGAYEEFTMQKIYDMNVELIKQFTGELENGGYGTFCHYKVTYKIMKNDGTFRRDLYSDAERPLFFSVIDDDDVTLIDRIGYSYSDIVD